MIWLVIVIPLVLAPLAYGLPSERYRPWLLPVGGVAHFAVTLALVFGGRVSGSYGWLTLDAPGRVVLASISALFLACSFYSVGYLRVRTDQSNRIFTTVMLIMLAAMSLVTEAYHLGLMWIAVEAMTLSAAPLLYFNRNPQSIEATWKYLMLGSVGVALALLGSFFLAYASLHEGLPSSLLVDDLTTHAHLLSRPWLHAGLLLCIVGYGTKMGLAPMHTWKPDAYGEAPGVVGALLSGGLASCSFLALSRIIQIDYAAGDAAFGRGVLVFMGFLSLLTASLFVLRQRDFKRMLAYSSVEHMGLLVLGLGVGGAAAFASFFHVMAHAMSKGGLFLAAANIHRFFGSKRVPEVSGALASLPWSAALFTLGFLAATGSPPFGVFISELMMAGEMAAQGHFFMLCAFLGLLALVFIGMGATVFAVVQGPANIRRGSKPFSEGPSTLIPAALLLAAALALGVWIPAPLSELLSAASAPFAVAR